MAPEQREAVDAFKTWDKRDMFFKALNDTDTTYHFPNLAKPREYFEKIFFLDALTLPEMEINLSCNTADYTMAGYLGRTHLETKETGRLKYVILLHPMRIKQRRVDYATRGQTVAEERLRVILHYMLHAFLTKHGCTQCQTRTSNQGQDIHGRAFMLIAKAIEEKSMRLLSVNVDMNRLTSWSLSGGQDGTSIHDLERYGFIDPLAGDGEAGDTVD